MSEKIDILFINPGDRKKTYQDLGVNLCALEPPVYVAMFAEYARRKHFSVAIYDAPALFASAEEAARVATEEYEPLLIVLPVYGFQPSASTQNMTSAGKIASLIREANPDARILMTGTHPAALPRRTMEEEKVDFVCDLEGPVTIEQVTLALRQGVTNFSNVPNLWWRDEGHIVSPSKIAPLLRELDTLMPGPAWDLLPMDRYRAHNWHCFDHIDDRQPYASIYTTLGCPFKCNFCCINAPFGKPSYRMWQPETVVANIDHLVQNYGVKNIKFVDEMFVLNKRHVSQICELLIQRGYDLNIWAYARVDTTYPELLDTMYAAGFRWLCLGIESASDYVRDGADKAMNNHEIKEACRRVQNAGIRIIGNYLFGLPDDSLTRMQETLDLASELNCEFANFYAAMAYPGSKLYEDSVRKGIALPNSWGDFSQHAYNTLPLANEHCSAAEILAFRDQAWDSYFTSERYLTMVQNKFGDGVVKHIREMTAIPLKRALLE